MEAFATACNVFANIIVMKTLCFNPKAPIPKTTLALQVSANLVWFLFGIISKDYFLATTASLSLGTQTVSLAVRVSDENERSQERIPTTPTMLKQEKKKIPDSLEFSSSDSLKLFSFQNS